MDRELFVHKEWLGLIQPVGLVVTARSLHRAQAIPDRAIATKLQPILQELIDDRGFIQDFPAFTQQILEWETSDLIDAAEGVEVYLENYSETLKPTYTVPLADLHRLPLIWTTDCPAPSTRSARLWENFSNILTFSSVESVMRFSMIVVVSRNGLV